jgi:hypothetical protein
MKFIIKLTLAAITIFAMFSLATSSKTSGDGKDLNLQTGLTSDGDGKVRYLKGINTTCPTGSALSAFRLRRSGSKLRYKASCLSHESINKSPAPTTHYTSYNDRKDSNSSKGTNYLDRQHVKCPAGTLLSGFQLQDNGSKMRYKFSCIKADLGTCYVKTTGKTEGGKNYSSIYLDRQSVKVTKSGKQALQGFSLKTKYIDWSWFKSTNINYSYRFTYCDVKTFKPTPIETTQAQEDQKALKVDARERNIRRR